VTGPRPSPDYRPDFVYLNDRLTPFGQASISPFDRGFLFGDGVYEGIRAFDSRIVAMERHIARMKRSLEEARIFCHDWFDPSSLADKTHELLAANGLTNAFIYWQVTRGVPPPGAPLRARVPPPDCRPTVFGFAIPARSLEEYRAPGFPLPVRASIRPDTRWTRGRLKSISLLGNVLATIEADELGQEDAILVRNGLVAEGSATNVILSHNGRLTTPSLDSVPMLEGVTRALVLETLDEVRETAVSVEDLLSADEILLLGTLTMVVTVTSLDGKPVGRATNGDARGYRPGPAARRVLDALLAAISADIHSGHA